MRYEDENIWLTQKMLSTLYDVSVPAINQHIKKIYEDHEQEPEATIKKYLIVQLEGNRPQTLKLQFKHQKFQADAAKAVCDVFAGQPHLIPTYMMDKGMGTYQIGTDEEKVFTGWGNQHIVPELNE